MLVKITEALVRASSFSRCQESTIYFLANLRYMWKCELFWFLKCELKWHVFRRQSLFLRNFFFCLKNAHVLDSSPLLILEAKLKYVYLRDTREQAMQVGNQCLFLIISRIWVKYVVIEQPTKANRCSAILYRRQEGPTVNTEQHIWVSIREVKSKLFPDISQIKYKTSISLTIFQKICITSVRYIKASEYFPEGVKKNDAE